MSKTIELLLATNNVGKRNEIVALLAQLDLSNIVVKTLKDVDPENQIPEPEETEQTFLKNAILKAKYYAARTKMIALAEDSGLEVDDLPDVLGVYSKRWFPGTDADRNAELLRRLNEARSAAEWPGTYWCAVCVVRPDKDNTMTFGQGECPVTIINEPRGENGFGYDPITLPFMGDGRTFAEMTHDEKAKYSHRTSALKDLARRLPMLFADIKMP